MELPDLSTLYAVLKGAGIVATQDDLSRLMGRCPSYIRSAKARKKPLSLESLIRFSRVMGRKANEYRGGSRSDIIKNATCNQMAIKARQQIIERFNNG